MGKFDVTWETLTEAEPRLLELYRAVSAVKDDGTEPAFCANDLWYGEDGFKDRMAALVGWGREEEGAAPADFLTTEEAYDLAYTTLYDLLPPCRNCGCWGIHTAKDR